MNSSRPLAVVTGASSGIGLELAREFAAQGHDLVLTAEDDGIHEAALQLRFHRTRIRAVRADLATYDGAESLIHEVRAEHRPVSAVVLNAGIGQGGAFLETDLADLARVIDLNISSTVHLARRLLPDMATQGGALASVSARERGQR
ncbi:MULTISPECIES: SDR family NAD(P)-dependent oxidoreductase [unclassified Streptomyces]|uniref:SDR family NAD(P)-dependent oxidoreductase n=1 Tax=unclassified Streptomyces TaxID=2593676 RepID=UPI003418D168